jgi:DNA-binding response OmpR family regulator
MPVPTTFALAELLARIRACDRRRRTRDVIEIGALVIDVAARTVTRGGEPIDLTVKEFDLLVELARGEGAVVRRTDLIADVWDEHWYGPTKTIDTHIWSLRRKLDEPGRDSWITTVRGVGYRLAEP